MNSPTTNLGRPELRAALIMLTLLLAAPWSSAAGQGVDSRLGFSHTAGQLPGLDDGYTRFNSFLPLVGPTDESLVFADLGFVLYNENTQADGANLGLGVRAFDSLANRIYGGYFYYDYRDTGHSHYNQLSWGFESLGAIIDYRVNAYLPVGDTWNSYFDSSAVPTFVGSHLYYTDIPQEVALRGVDTEAVGLLLDQGTWQLRGGAGVYGFWHPHTGVSAIGPRARLELRVADQLWINGSVQHDDEFDTTAALSISWRYGLTRHFEPCSSSQSVACRLGDPVERQDQISIKHYIGGPSTDRLVTTADGHAYTFHHVDSSASNGGDGTVESPSNSLAAASYQAEDIVLLHGGSQFLGQQLVTMTEGQRVLAEGVPHTLNTQRGTILLPEVGNGVSPTILLSAGDAVVIEADGVEVSGLDIRFVSESTIDSIRYQEVLNSGLTFSDYGSLSDFFLLARYGSGIVATDVNGISINRNTVADAIDSGIELQNVHGASSVEGNTVSSSSNPGLLIYGEYSGAIVGNSLNNNASEGLIVFGNVAGNVVGNQVVGNNTGGRGEGGLVVLGSIDGSVSANVVDASQGYGILVAGDVSGDFKDNRAVNISDQNRYYLDYDDDWDAWEDGNDEADDLTVYGADSIAWFAADLPEYDPNEHAVLSGLEMPGLYSLLSSEQERVGVPLLVHGSVAGEVSGNVGSVTAGVNLQPNVTVIYPPMQLHSE